MITIVIPAYEMHGKGLDLLKRCLDSIEVQTFKDYDVFVSDNSDDEDIEELCVKYSFVKHMKNPRKGMAQNTNFAMRHAEGDIIKILYQDDYLTNENALKEIAESFTDDVVWLATGCTSENGVHYPYYTGDIYTGNNKIGSPSVITIRNKDILLFDENMTWVLDCDYYKRMYDLYGEPKYLHKVCVTLGLGKHQTTNQLSEDLKRQEIKYSISKYE